MDTFKRFFSQLQLIYQQLTPGRRIVALCAIGFTILSLAAIIFWTNHVTYATLYTNLTQEDAGSIIARLKDMKVAYRIGDGGTSIQVPSRSVYEMRMALASEGLPQSGGIGYEIFDQQSIGVTEFIQKVNYHRAMEGELARTIKQFAEIRSARVHLSLPEKALFSEDQQEPSASIVLQLQHGGGLRAEQVQGIAHLVASSVEGLSPDNVIIVDSHGNMLAGGSQRLEYADLTVSQQQIQQTIAQELERKIESMLGSVVGPGKVKASVAVSMDFTQVEQTEESYDPDAAAVRSEQRSSEKSSGSRPGSAGIPGVVSNTPDLQADRQAGAQQATTSYNKSDETVNYEISRITKRTVSKNGTVSRITAAVLVDGIYEIADDGTRTYVPQTPEAMKKFRAIVQQAIGYNEVRGDAIEVVNAQFEETYEDEYRPVDAIIDRIDWQSLVLYLVTAFLLALFIIFGLRPLLRTFAAALKETRTQALSSQGAALEGRAAGAGLPEGSGVPENLLAEHLTARQSSLLTFAQKNPRLFAQYLKNWLQ